MYKCTFFAVYTFFVGTADRKCKKKFYIFRGGSGELRQKMYNFLFLHFSFSVATKNKKKQKTTLLQAREVLNLERHPTIACITSPEPNAAR